MVTGKVIKYWLALPLLVLITAVVQAKDSFEQAGDFLQFAIPATGFGMTYWYQDPEGREQFVKAVGSSLATTWALKVTLNQPRPNGGDYSFPSGHTTAAFAGAAFIERRYGWQAGFPAYLMASYVGWSRVHADKHYIADVLAGAGLSIAYNYYFVDAYQTTSPVLFSLNEDQVTISWMLRF